MPIVPVDPARRAARERERAASPARGGSAPPSKIEIEEAEGPSDALDGSGAQGLRTGPNWDGEGNYKVGKNKPPAAHRFKPGVSGNPRGPKPGSRGVIAQAREILGAKVPVKIGGRTRKLDAVGVALTVLYDKVSKGDLKAIETVLRLGRESRPDKPMSDVEPISAAEQTLIEELLGAAGFAASPVVRKRASNGAKPEEADQ